ncbi:serine protease [Cellulomonas sp. URHD0024]|uniref:S1 family peptidase n=1 Tax=Cellulomonas sp. URHD0024 TaxID=1302620 RepID=UPI00040C68EB|nr:serine protease [Cellulomonas sp. URHD0024]
MTDANETSASQEAPLTFNVRHTTFTIAGLSADPQHADDTSLDGAILIVGLVRSEGGLPELLGSAVFIAPGLAVTATHVFGDRVRELLDGTLKVQCFTTGTATTGVLVWTCYHISHGENEDLALLSLRCESPLPPEFVHTMLPTTTRMPVDAEPVTVLGYRVQGVSATANPQTGEVVGEIAGNLLIARGSVTQVHMPRRDPHLLPFPAFTISCGTRGGMSGGAVVDAWGMLIGVVSTGLQTSDEEDLTNAAWMLNAWRHSMSLTYPVGMYPPGNLNILDLSPELCRIEGRSAFTITGVDEVLYVPWTDGDNPPAPA